MFTLCRRYHDIITFTICNALHACEFAVEYDVKFNCNKSVAIHIGTRYNVMCEPFVLSGNKLQFVCSVKYLGIVLVSDRKIKFSVDHVKVKFFRAFNCIYYKSKGANSELVTVELLKSYCIPGLLYAAEAISLSATNIRILDNCINRALYKIFGACNNENLLYLRHCFGLPSLLNMIENRRRKFLDRVFDDTRFSALCGTFIRFTCL